MNPLCSVGYCPYDGSQSKQYSGPTILQHPAN